MAIRTNVGLIKGLPLCVADGNPLTRAIRWANSVTNRMVTCATAKGFVHTSDELIDIETLLAAHHYMTFDPQYTSKTTDGASGSFDIKQPMDLAKISDGSGCLAAILGPEGKGPIVASLDWMGLPPSEQTPFYERD